MAARREVRKPNLPAKECKPTEQSKPSEESKQRKKIQQRLYSMTDDGILDATMASPGPNGPVEEMPRTFERGVIVRNIVYEMRKGRGLELDPFSSGWPVGTDFEPLEPYFVDDEPEPFVMPAAECLVQWYTIAQTTKELSLCEQD